MLQNSSDDGALVMSVGECVALVNQTLEYAFSPVVVEGEVGSFGVNQGKYVFFDIKDSEATLGCFMTVWQLRIPLENGMRVRVVAQPKLTKWGKFSLTVREVIPTGEGSLKRAYELLKDKLDKEGLFAPERKRSLPRYPEAIGLISSEQAAGYADFVKIAAARWPLAKLMVRHCRVQGATAADDIIDALRSLNELAEPPEAIAIVRGGGSADDLACFNDEKLVRAISASRIPVIAGIGHEVDETLASLAADVMASTPSNAAELLMPDEAALRLRLGERRATLGGRLTAVLNEQKQALAAHRQRISVLVRMKLDTTRKALEASRTLLRQLDPNTVLRRGYSVVRSSSGNIVRDGRELQPGDTLSIETAKAILQSEVRSVHEK